MSEVEREGFSASRDVRVPVRVCVSVNPHPDMSCQMKGCYYHPPPPFPLTSS